MYILAIELLALGPPGLRSTPQAGWIGIHVASIRLHCHITIIIIIIIIIIIKIIIIIVMDDNDVPRWFTQGKASLIPKPGAFSSDNTR